MGTRSTPYNPDERAEFYRYLDEGWTVRAACEFVGCGYRTGKRWAAEAGYHRQAGAGQMVRTGYC